MNGPRKLSGPKSIVWASLGDLVSKVTVVPAGTVIELGRNESSVCLPPTPA